MGISKLVYCVVILLGLLVDAVGQVAESQINLFIRDKVGNPVINVKDSEISVGTKDRGVTTPTSFRFVGDSPWDLALVVDTSASAARAKEMTSLVNGVITFLRKNLRSDKDLAMAVDFSSDVFLTQDFTNEPDRIVHELNQVKGGGGTALYDAVVAVSARLNTAPSTQRKFMLLLSDGGDNQSHVTREEASRGAQERCVVIFALAVGPLESPERKVMEEFAEVTGGKAFFPKSDADVQKSLDEIKILMDAQYQLAIPASEPSKKPKKQHLRIVSLRDGLEVTAPKTLYSPSIHTQIKADGPHPPSNPK